MPKKHTPTYTHTKPTYVHPSLQSARPSSSSTPPASQTVNERIQQLRREQTPRATAERIDQVTEVATQRTVPPELRRILHLAEIDAPRPKAGSRARPVPRPGARPPPGPAAPSSWLARSRHAPREVRNLRKYVEASAEGRVEADFGRLARVHDGEYQRLPPRRSLVHQCLKTLAANWEELVEYEQHYLYALTISLKEALISYLSLYGSRECLSPRSLKVLFHDGHEGGSGPEELRFLDLTHLLGPKYTLDDLQKSLKTALPSNVTSKLAGLEVGPAKGKEKVTEEVVDSWEDEAEADTAHPNALSSTLATPVFSNLTRLSLAHPGSSASWKGLLSVSKSLNTLTHLSLAYWPIPSATPNAATTSMIYGNQRIALGGSHFYSELDNDWHEAANILRRLAQHTYCLKWLDLEGCIWHRALTWEADDAPHAPALRRDTNRDAVQWAEVSTASGPDFNGPWRQLEYLNLSQGWIPQNLHALRAMPAGVVPVQLLSWLREHAGDEEYAAVLRDELAEYSVSEWVEREKVARSVERDVRALRSSKAGKWCAVDHGWVPVVGAGNKPKGQDE